VKNNNGITGLDFVTYDIVAESTAVTVSGMLLAEAALTVEAALLDGEPINSAKIMNALERDKVYSEKVRQHTEALREILHENKEKTAQEKFEDRAVQMLVDIEKMASRLTTEKVW
jgi:hypothetical protein